MSTKKGRAFEQLVIQIQGALSPGDVITPNDSVLDLKTGELREVDATIRFSRDGICYLVAIESRDWQGSQDVRWIEQLATKRVDIGAHAMIVVSSHGFSETAIKKAKLNNLQLRCVSEVTVEDIRTWCLLDGLTVRLPYTTPVNVFIEHEEHPLDGNSDDGPVPLDASQLRLNDPVAFAAVDGRPLTAMQLVKLWEESGGCLFDPEVDNEPVLYRAAHLRFAPGDVYSVVDGRRWSLSWARIECQIRFLSIVAPVIRVFKCWIVDEGGEGELLVDAVEFAPTPIGQFTIYWVPQPTGEARMVTRLDPTKTQAIEHLLGAGDVAA